MKYVNIGYAAMYFKYKTPKLITGKPTDKSLKRLNTELRANISSVDSDLGGKSWISRFSSKRFRVCAS